MDSVLNIIVPAAELSLLTIAELREAAGVSDGSQDIALLRLGRRASSAIARACCVRGDGVTPITLLSETCEERFDWVRGCDLRLARRPITSIVSITVGGNAQDVSAFDLKRAAGKVRAANGWGSGEVVITYVAGLLAAPEELKEAATKLAVALRSDAGRDPNLKREDIPGVIEREWWVSEKDNPLMSQEIHDLIAPYVERWV